MYRYVLACPANSPAVAAVDVTCPRAVAACPPGELQNWLFRAPAGVDPAPWEQIGTRCLAPGAGAAAPTFPGFTLADFRRLPLPAGRATVQPGEGDTLVGVPTNVYAEAAAVVLATDVVGFPVRVRATPSRYAWSFGDGASLGPTGDPGAAHPAGTLAHAYASPGDYRITLTTQYTGEYSVAGGPWLPIEGEAAVASAAVPVHVVAGRTALVAGTVGS